MYSPQLVQDMLLEALPNNEEAAICAEYAFENQLVNLPQNLAGNRNRETISRNLFVLYKKGLCNRISRFKDDSDAHIRFYYWKVEPATKTYSSNKVEPLQKYLLRHLPRTVEEAVTPAELAFYLHISHREKVVANTIWQLYLNNEVDRTEMKPYRYWIGAGGSKRKTACISSQEEVTSSKTQDMQLLVAGIQRAGYNVDPYVYCELATLEAQYISWLELSDTYIISPNSATFHTYKNNPKPSKDSIAVSKSLTTFLNELSCMPREDARGVLAHLKEGTPKKAIEILRIANDEAVMKRIESGQIPEFVDSIWAILSRGLEVFHPTIITKPTFLQWFIAQLGVNLDITQSNVSAIKNHRLETIIKYDEKAQKLENKHLPGYPSVASPLIQMDSSSQQDILTRIKTVEDDITQIHERYAKIEGIIQEKELSIKLQKLEQSKDKEQQKLDLLEEKLRKGNTDDLKVRSGILK